MSEKAIFTNMCMVYYEDQILVQKRQKKDWPGITFPGGHVKAGESFVASTIREVREETGLTVANLELCGTKQFQTEADERYVVLCYRTNSFSGQLRPSREGDVFWIPRQDLFNYPLSPEFDLMFQLFDREDISEFYYYRSANQAKGWQTKFF